jgi:hypothetical protein
MVDHFQEQARFWGIAPSYAFVQKPQTNCVIERLFRALKERAIHGRVQTINEVRHAVRNFAARDSADCLIEKKGDLSLIHARAGWLDTDL